MTFRQLTPNFNELEFYVHEAPPEYIRANKLPKVAALCQWLRDLAGSPGIVNSYYRSPARNAVVAESGDHSQHIVGEAADVSFLLISTRELANRVLAAVAAGRAPAFGQIIFYPDTTHVHISLPGATHNGDVQIATRGSDPGPRLYSMLSFDGLRRLSSVPGGVAVLLVALALGLAITFFFPALSV